jgi:hypothetical protein
VQSISKKGAVMKRSIVVGMRMLLALAAVGSVVFAAGDASAQQKQKYYFKTPPGVAKYTQQPTIDVGDVPGHQLRLVEAHSVYTNEAPMYDGVRVKESWTRAVTDYTDGTGNGSGYTLAVLENGDKIFGRYEVVNQTTIGSDGTKVAKGSTVNILTGGTGKFKGIRGTLRGSIVSDFKSLSDVVYEGEYWIEN